MPLPLSSSASAALSVPIAAAAGIHDDNVVENGSNTMKVNEGGARGGAPPAVVPNISGANAAAAAAAVEPLSSSYYLQMKEDDNQEAAAAPHENGGEEKERGGGGGEGEGDLMFPPVVRQQLSSRSFSSASAGAPAGAASFSSSSDHQHYRHHIDLPYYDRNNNNNNNNNTSNKRQHQQKNNDNNNNNNNVTAFVTLLKALFGVSLLSSPRVLGETGLILGTLVYGGIILACAGSCWCLLQARAKVVSTNQETTTTTATATAATNKGEGSKKTSAAGEASPQTYHHQHDDDQRPPWLMSSSPPSQQQQQQQQQASAPAPAVAAITYGDLGKTLLGKKSSVLINFLIVSLHICFGAGLFATSIHQISIVLNWETDTSDDDDNSNYYNNYNNNNNEHQEEEEEQGEGYYYYAYGNDDNEVEFWLLGRLILSCILFPIIALLLQFRNVQDLFRICLAGILVFVFGCIGTMIYSTIVTTTATSSFSFSSFWIGTSNDDDNYNNDSHEEEEEREEEAGAEGGSGDDDNAKSSSSSSWWNKIPQDALEWKFSGIPNFVASTLCAMEGINLALPIANQFYLTATGGAGAAAGAAVAAANKHSSTNTRRTLRSNTTTRRTTSNTVRPSSSNNEGSSSSSKSTVVEASDDDEMERSPVPVVTAAVGFFGFITLLVAYIGYLNGLGGSGGGGGQQQQQGGEGGGGEQEEENCPAVAHCLDSTILETIHRLSLTAALILTLPIILYPSLELLERWSEERQLQLMTGKTSSNRTIVDVDGNNNDADGGCWNGFVMFGGGCGCGDGDAPYYSDSFKRQLYTEEVLFGKEPYFPFLHHRHWRLRLAHAAAVCVIAIVDRPWERGLVLFKGIGLSTACFVLPVILFVRAHSLTVVLQKPALAAALGGLVSLGLVNMILVIMSVFTEHNFLPPEVLHEDPLGHHHHHSQDDSNSHDDSKD